MNRYKKYQQRRNLKITFIALFFIVLGAVTGFIATESIVQWYGDIGGEFKDPHTIQFACTMLGVGFGAMVGLFVATAVD